MRAHVYRGGGGAGHRWKFRRIGGVYEVVIESGEDFRRLAELDPKLWVALSCPTRGLELDPVTLDLVDTDGDGRIRVPELLDAVGFAVTHLKDPTLLLSPETTLPLEAINDQVPSGARLLSSAREILANTSSQHADSLTVEQATDAVRLLSRARFNGDGIVPPESADEPAVQHALRDILATVGGKPDRSGRAGADTEIVQAFFAELRGFAAWWAQAEAADQGGEGVLPLGADTPPAYAALQAVRGKIDDYFARCRLAAFDARAAAYLNRGERELAALAAGDLSTLGDDVADLPLAHVEAGAPLPLGQGINPAWTGRLAAFVEKVVRPVLGPGVETLDESGWSAIGQYFAPYGAWMSSKAGAHVEKLGIQRIRELLASDAEQAVADLIARDLEKAPQLAAVEDVNRLARYQRDLYTLLNNFVSFADFYARDKQALFQAGILYLDRRGCRLCVKVADAAKHAALAALSNIYIVYCECTRKDQSGTLTIAAGFTAGDSDHLMVGRNGIFYDRQGRDWDATIVKIIENPISLWQAFTAPYKRAARIIGDQLQKWASARDKAVEAQTRAGASRLTESPAAAGPAAAAGTAPTAFDIGKTVGIFAALALAAGAVGTAFAALVKAFLAVAWWQKLLAVLAVLVLISGPSVLLSWLKLRLRVLGPLLDATGWAVNARVKINAVLGRTLTDVGALPRNAACLRRDPYTRRASRWRLVMLAALLAAVFFAWLRLALHGRV
ncbi:MAG: hypothetical protein JW951_05585 [Lentisphaerae bacterium]|nr:hypothetical protein [Lentisphaerota bacterium]